MMFEFCLELTKGLVCVKFKVGSDGNLLETSESCRRLGNIQSSAESLLTYKVSPHTVYKYKSIVLVQLRKKK
jgi:hypothetical protein